LEAYLHADDVARDVWDFAVEMRSLRDAGLTSSDLRWLVCRGFVAHRVELRRSDEDERKFQDAGELTFHERSCFVLTSAGSAFADELDAPPAGDGHPVPSLGQTQDGNGHPKKDAPSGMPRAVNFA